MNRKQLLVTSLLIALVVGVAVLAPFGFLKGIAPPLPREKMRPGAAQTAPAQAGSQTSGSAVASTEFPIALPPANTPLATVLSQLEAQAMAGSPKAACRIAQDIHRCTNAIKSLDVAEILSLAPKAPGQKETLADTLLRQSEASLAFCAKVDAETLDSGYRFQRLAARHGGAGYERWLVVMPALDQEDFLSHLDDWKDYLDRAKVYLDRSLAQRKGDDLALLATVYAPSNRMLIRPPYRVDDDVTFLALHELARRNRIVLPIPLEQMAVELKAGLSREESRQVDASVLQLDGGWQVKKPGRLPHEDIVEAGNAAFCR